MFDTTEYSLKSMKYIIDSMKSMFDAMKYIVYSIIQYV